MVLKPKLRRRTAWLALCVFLFGSLAASLAQAMPALTGKSWVEICSAAGPSQIQVDAEQDPLAGTHAAKSYCPFLLLLLHVPPIAAATQVHSSEPHLPGSVLYPSEHPRAVAPAFRRANPSRAPPRFS